MGNSNPVITVFGLGEAGSLIATDLVAAGAQVHAYDPKPVATPEGVIRHDNPQDAVALSQVVIALTASADACEALNQAFSDIPETAVYADFSTSSADLKQRLAGHCYLRKLAFVDIALMSVVLGKGLNTPALASGDGAERFVRLFSSLGMPVEVISERAGDAATRKLLRSVMMKGLAAVVIEAMEAAHEAGCSEWLWKNMVEEISKANELLLARLVKGTRTHALRRLHEMQASSELVDSLGIDPIMTRAIVANLQKVLEKWLHPQDEEEQTSIDKVVPQWLEILQT
jgi:3-hydroxyisobutyrate dehydrogenase-like beta-hydroxyacid dehydrogenase